MATLIRIAFRNIFRFKRRTFITLSSISIGLGLLIISISLMNGIDRQSIRNIINCQTSHLKIVKQGYFEKRDEFPLDLTIRDPERVRVGLQGVPGIEGTEARILFGVGLIKGVDELPCLGVAIDPLADPEIFVIKDSLIMGEWLEPEDIKMVVGRGLADDIGISVGDLVTIRLITSSVEDSFSWNALDVEVKGIFDSGNPAVDNQRLFIPLQLGMNSLSLPNQVTEIVVKLTGDSDALISGSQEKIRELLRRHDEPLDVVTWKDLAGTFLAVSRMKTQRQTMIILIMLVIASLGIINTMLMAVMERTREIGMMAALGMKKKELMYLFIFEGGFIGLIGSFLGCFLGAITGWYLEVHGISIASFGNTINKMTQSIYPVSDTFYGYLTMDILLITFFLGVFIAIVASVYPAWKAVKLSPIEALRHI